MRNSRRERLRICAIVFVVAGPFLGVVTIISALSISNFIHHAAHANGNVIGLRKSVDRDNEVIYSPTFTFKTQSGQLIEKESDAGSNPPDFAVGQQVQILFEPTDPQSAKIATKGQLWLAPIVTGGLCIGFSSLGLFLLWFTQIAPISFTGRTN